MNRFFTRHKICRVLCWLSSLTSLSTAAHAAPQEICVYRDARGVNREVIAKDLVPARFRRQARCIPMAQQEYLAQPKDIQLKGNVREEQMSSPIGSVHLRWPRKVENLFGRTPLRATAEAARTVARALQSPGFPAELQTMSLDWQIIFLDENLPDTQIPSRLISNCHPGWMTPPANIYVVAQRVASGCTAQNVSTSIADPELTFVLLHEMGHAVEYALLAQRLSPDLLRSEGFAVWFSLFAANYSPLLSLGEVKQRIASLARQSLREDGPTFRFKGSAADYGRASLYFSAIVKQRGIRGLVSVYQQMASRGTDFFSAVEASLGWSRQRFEDEANSVIAD